MNNRETTSYVVDILAHAKTRPDRVALTSGGRSLAYGDLPAELSHRADRMAAAGLGSGTVAAIVTRDPVEDILVRLALSCLGGLCCSLDPDMDPAERQRRAEHYGIDILLEGEDCASTDLESRATPTLRMTADWRDAGPGRITPIHPAPPGAVVVSSSGTTGLPGLTVFSHHLLRMNADWLIKANVISPETVFLNQMPHFINAGTTLTAMMLSIGATCVVKPDIRSAEEMVDAVLTHEATMLVAPPFFLPPFIAIAQNRGHHPLFPKVSSLWVIGDFGQSELLEKAAKWITPNVFLSYGSSNTGLISLLGAADFESGRGSVGRAFENVTVQIVDQDDQPVPVGQPGSVRVMMPARIEATLGPVRDNGEEMRDGYIYTGDDGRLDEDGFLYILGRSTDMIFWQGARIYPTKIEGVFKACPGVREIAVAGVPSSDGEKAPVAFVVRQGEVSAQDLQNFAEQSLEKSYRPVDYVFCEILPRNHLGKVIKRQLIAGYSST